MIIREGLQQQALPKSWNCQNWSLFWGTILFLGANLSLSWVNYHFSLAFVHFINQIHQKIFAWVRHPPPPPFWQCQDFGSACCCKPSLSVFEYCGQNVPDLLPFANNIVYSCITFQVLGNLCRK